jgi:glycosyltransferase involved in cell wall biosynthesis
VPNDKIAIVHYSVPPVVGGVESVIGAQVRSFLEAGFPVTLIAGKGEKSASLDGCDLILIPEMDTQHPEIVLANAELEQGRLPESWDGLVENLAAQLRPILALHPNWIVHNIFTKHFNLPLTCALQRLLDENPAHQCLAWCHDLSWTSAGSRAKLHEGFPWDLLRLNRQDITYIAVSKQRQQELAGLLKCPVEAIHVIYNGVDLQQTLGISNQGMKLARRLEILDAYPILLMPVRVTRAKNIEFAIVLASAIKAAGADPRLVITGPPDPHSPESMAYFEELKAIRRRNGMDEVVRFVYDSGPDPGKPYTIPAILVWELMRMSDAVMMTSLREGFGMPVLEAGAAGVPVITSRHVPAAIEIASQEVLVYPEQAAPHTTARQITDWLDSLPAARLRRKVRADLAWEKIFDRQIRPLLRMTEPES